MTSDLYVSLFYKYEKTHAIGAVFFYKNTKAEPLEGR